MSRAVYCVCKGKYTLSCDKGSKKCKYDGALTHGIGSLVNQGQSNITSNESTRNNSRNSTDYNL